MSAARARFLIVAVLALSAPHARVGPPPPPAARPSLETIGRLPLAFEPDASGRERFVARGPGYSVRLDRADAIVRTFDGAATIRLSLAGASHTARATAIDRQAGVSHYLIGSDRSAWRTNVPRYGAVRFDGVYDGIDVVYYGNQRQLEHDFEVAPGADPRQIAIDIAGADGIAIEPSGDLLLKTGGGPLRLRRPVAYQRRGSSRVPVAARFEIDDRQDVRFAIGDYDRSRPLVIDPVLAYSTYAGGGGADYAFGIAVDGSGNAYVAGATDSADFTTTTGAFDRIYGGSTGVPPRGDAYVIKLDPAGALVYATYVGGSDLDIAYGVAVDSAGSAYITGRTISTNFPITPGVFQPEWGNAPFSSFGDMFVTKLNPAGSALSYSTFLAGYSLTTGYGIAVDSQGNAVVVGETNFEFRTPNPLVNQPTAAFSDAFVVKLNSTASGLIYAKLLGGNDLEQGLAVALDAAGNAYVAGHTSSTNFPVLNAAQPNYGGGQDSFVAKISPSGTTVYCTYLGGNDFDSRGAIAVDGGGNAYTTGSTNSANFPVTAGALRTTKAAFTDAYVTKFNASGAFAYSTFLGAGNFEHGSAIAVDPSGNAYVAGHTQSSDFPVVSPIQPTLGALGTTDLFLTQLNASGSGILFSTFLGGSALDEAAAMALDSSLNVYLAGQTRSTNFPTLSPFQPTHHGGTSEIVIAKVRTVVPVMSLDRTSLAFAALTSGSAMTGPQAVRLTQAGSGTVTWTATSSQPWLTVSPPSGSGSATLTVSIAAGAGLPPPGTHAAAITLTYSGASTTGATIAVTLNVLTTGTSAAPAGSFDTPIDGTTGVTGSIAVTGWAVDDIEVTRVRIFRDPVLGEGTAPIFIGDAVLVEGARPDVAAAFPTAPRNTRAGWGYLLLTNFLPNLGNGTFTLRAFAEDADGHSTPLGSKIITCTNNTAIAPFGAIDTPLQGETVSGTINDFGWVLSRGTTRSDPPSGGIVNVVIDGAVVGQPAGWVSRPDLTALFPQSQYSGVTNALGVYTFDTLTLANGVHTIAWVVIDNLGAAAGIGSRYFTVSNGAGNLTLPASSLQRPASSYQLPALSTGVVGRRGYDLDAPLRTYSRGSDGIITIQSEELDRIELHPGPGLQVTGAAGARLPIGARYDAATGVFTWQPGVGFLGAHDFLFGGERLRIVLNPKGSNRVGPQIAIDAPSRRRFAAGAEILVAGWAADLDAATGSGVDTVHVWAYPANGGRPVFLGVAEYGGSRPDVAAIYGAAFLKSGYGQVVRGLPAGTYDVAVFAYSTVRAAFAPAKTVRVEIR